MLHMALWVGSESVTDSIYLVWTDQYLFQCVNIVSHWHSPRARKMTYKFV